MASVAYGVRPAPRGVGTGQRSTGKAAEPDCREARAEDDQEEAGADEGEGDFLALFDVADARLEVGVDARQIGGGRGGEVRGAGDRGDLRQRLGVGRHVERDHPTEVILDLDLAVGRAERDRVDRDTEGLGAPGRLERLALPTDCAPSERRMAATSGWPDGSSVGVLGWALASGAADAPGVAAGLGEALASGVSAFSFWIFSAMSRTCISASPMAVPSRAVSPSMASLSCFRSAVGLTSVTGSDANETIPTRMPSGS